MVRRSRSQRTTRVGSDVARAGVRVNPAVSSCPISANAQRVAAFIARLVHELPTGAIRFAPASHTSEDAAE
jgi:hypothetical protein